MMKKRILLALAIAGIARPDSLEDVLARMDSAARAFKSYSANVKMVDYTKIIDETVPSAGSMRFQRSKNGLSGIVDFSAGKDPYIVHLDGPKGQKYLPKANEIQEFNLRKLAPTMDQILLLGFSVTREDMLRDYDVKLGGPDKVGSTETTRIVLTPKSAETLKVVRTIELWIPDGKGYPIQEKEMEPNKDYRLATYSDLQLNPTLPASAFELPASASRAKRIKEN
jgi:outer membrane lipoprotein-sorting protein